MQTIHFSIAGSAVVLPAQAIGSDQIDLRIGKQSGYVESTFGIRQRFWANADETSSAMAAAAAQQALDDAHWRPESLDLIVGACGVMEQPIPGTAPLVQRRLGLGRSGIPAIDVNATCLSFLLALDHVLGAFALGRAKRALVFTADIASAALDFSNHEGSVIFGDGATAFALSADGPHGWLSSLLETYGDGADLCRLEAGGTRLRPHEDLPGFLAGSTFQMDGTGVFRAVARRFPAVMDRLLGHSGVKLPQVETVIPHQASATALEHLKRSLPDGHARTVDIFRDHGNQIASSMPHALHVARTTGRLRQGTHSLLIGSSAGVSLGGAVVRW